MEQVMDWMALCWNALAARIQRSASGLCEPLLLSAASGTDGSAVEPTEAVRLLICTHVNDALHSAELRQGDLSPGSLSHRIIVLCRMRLDAV